MTEGAQTSGDDALARPASDDRRERRRTAQFVTVFAISVLALLTGYRFLIDTYANDWYLYQVARHTSAALTLVGHSSELEGLRANRAVEPKRLRAELQAWQDGRESATPEEIGAATEGPLSKWEVYMYRITKMRRDNPRMPVGPRVSFVFRAGTATYLAETEDRIAALEARPDAQFPVIQMEIEELKKQAEGYKAQLRDEARSRMPAPEDGGAAVAAGAEAGSAQQAVRKPYVFNFIVVPACGAIEVMAIFFSAVVAFPTLWRKRALGLLLGMPIMYGLNVVRLSCLAVIGALDGGGKWFEFAHHYVWQSIYIIFVVVVWLLWIEFIVRRRRA